MSVKATSFSKYFYLNGQIKEKKKKKKEKGEGECCIYINYGKIMGVEGCERI